MSEKKPLYQSPGEKGKRGFEDLECYQLALEAMAKIHAFSETLPAKEKYDLYSQIRRASKGVTGNIAEAYGRYHYLDSLHYYSIARGELNETLAKLIDARVLEYINQTEFEELYKLIRQTEQTLNGFMSFVRRQRAGSQEYGDKKLREEQTEYEIEIDENGER
ncbi:MAG: four helix bundle protein [Anaerolineales bacterium]|nr:four helix bundle protein [Anaerolineales bacterium]MBX3038773.1 four helix bundle protein [Anaerolineales bacterium]